MSSIQSAEQWFIKYFKCCKCCFNNNNQQKEEDQESKPESEQDKEARIVRQQIIEVQKIYHAAGIPNHSADEAAVRFANKIRINKKKKMHNKITGTVDDFNSIVFNKITDRC